MQNDIDDAAGPAPADSTIPKAAIRRNIVGRPRGRTKRRRIAPPSGNELWPYNTGFSGNVGINRRTFHQMLKDVPTKLDDLGGDRRHGFDMALLPLVRHIRYAFAFLHCELFRLSAIFELVERAASLASVQRPQRPEPFRASVQAASDQVRASTIPSSNRRAGFPCAPVNTDATTSVWF